MLYFLKKCWFRHKFNIVQDTGQYIYKECKKCGLREVSIVRLGHNHPNYEWVNHETDTI